MLLEGKSYKFVTNLKKVRRSNALDVAMVISGSIPCMYHLSRIVLFGFKHNVFILKFTTK